MIGFFASLRMTAPEFVMGGEGRLAAKPPTYLLHKNKSGDCHFELACSKQAK